MKVIQSRLAREDLLSIWTYVATDNEEAASRLLRTIDHTCLNLAEFPNMGPLREELGVGLRSFPVGNYVIFYYGGEEGITVVRVLHGAMDLPGLWKGRGAGTGGA